MTTASKSSDLNEQMDGVGDPPGELTPYLPADFEHWAKAAYWTPFEAACLSLGFGPRLLANSTEAQLNTDADLLSAVYDRFDLAIRVDQSGIVGEMATPHSWLAWMRRVGLSFPDELAEWIEKVPDLKALGFSKKSGQALLNVVDELQGVAQSAHITSGQTREIMTLERMVAAMAISGYGYDPQATRCSTATEIANDANANGIELHVDTARKYLKRSTDNHYSQMAS